MSPEIYNDILDHDPHADLGLYNPTKYDEDYFEKWVIETYGENILNEYLWPVPESDDPVDYL